MCGCAFMTTTTRRVPVGAGVLYDAASPTGTLSLHEAQRSMTQDSTEKSAKKSSQHTPACPFARSSFRASSSVRSLFRPVYFQVLCMRPKHCLRVQRESAIAGKKERTDARRRQQHYQYSIYVQLILFNISAHMHVHEHSRHLVDFGNTQRTARISQRKHLHFNVISNRRSEREASLKNLAFVLFAVLYVRSKYASVVTSLPIYLYM